jgi:2-amino-4-hydroxy-6-hydroxymethyldihydropteridine diphosphokinase
VSVDVLLSLGGNMGDRKRLMDEAVDRLNALPETSVRARSSYYRTEPVGPVKQDWFLNIAVALRTGQSRDDLVAAGRAIETALGRDRSKEVSWGPRPMDIDVVGYGDWYGMDDRAFVLVPLAEIAPALLVDGKSLADRAVAIGTRGVKKLNWPVPPPPPR